MKKFILILSVFALNLAAGEAIAQNKQRQDVIATRGADAKYQLPTTDVVAPKPDPSRGSCCLNFDNYTGYTIYVWVDGEYRGTVSAWGEGSICVGSGWTTYYARTAGGTYSWSGNGDCRGFFNLKLE